MKQAIFTAVDNGIEGKDPDIIVFASQVEAVRDHWLENNPNKNWYSKKDMVVDLKVCKKQALAKLDGLDKLALAI